MHTESEFVADSHGGCAAPVDAEGLSPADLEFLRRVRKEAAVIDALTRSYLIDGATKTKLRYCASRLLFACGMREESAADPCVLVAGRATE